MSEQTITTSVSDPAANTQDPSQNTIGVSAASVENEIAKPENSETSEETTKPEQQEKTFTQAEVDGIIARRLAKVQAQLDGLKKAKDESVQETKQDAQEKLSALEADLEKTRSELQAKEINAAVEKAALEQGVPLKKLPLINKLVEKDGLLGEEGLDNSAVANAVKAVLELAPELATGGVPVGSQKGVGNGPGSAASGPKEPQNLYEAILQKYGS